MLETAYISSRVPSAGILRECHATRKKQNVFRETKIYQTENETFSAFLKVFTVGFLVQCFIKDYKKLLQGRERERKVSKT